MYFPSAGMGKDADKHFTATIYLTLTVYTLVGAACMETSPAHLQDLSPSRQRTGYFLFVPSCPSHLLLVGSVPLELASLVQLSMGSAYALEDSKGRVINTSPNPSPVPHHSQKVPSLWPNPQSLRTPMS